MRWINFRFVPVPLTSPAYLGASMFRDPLRFTARCAVLLLGLILVSVPPAFANDSKAGSPGRFDFYVLALSWSPSFCEKQSPARRARNPQCNGRPFAFVVHGLWPEYEQGFPSYCRVPAQRLTHPK